VDQEQKVYLFSLFPLLFGFTFSNSLNGERTGREFKAIDNSEVLTAALPFHSVLDL
jgi:hypothetical protein